VRREEGVGCGREHRLQLFAFTRRLFGEHIERRSKQVTGFERRRHRLHIHHIATAGVEQVRALFHLCDLFGANEFGGFGRAGHVQRHKVCSRHSTAFCKEK
jgi:hypothetical protein